jgi:hypothetical protein
MTSRPPGALCFRKTSRASLFARLRSTAEPSFRVAATPSREAVPPFGAMKTIMRRPWTRLPTSYARSNSGRRRTRSLRLSLSVIVGVPHALPLVGNRQALPALGPAPLEHDPSVLGRHADQESVRLFSAPSIRLVGALPFGHMFRRAEISPQQRSGGGGGNFNTSRRSLAVSKKRGATTRVLQFAIVFGRWRVPAFGFSPKISTPVENTVENRDLRSSWSRKARFQPCFIEAKPAKPYRFDLPGPGDVTNPIHAGESPLFVPFFHV